MIRKSVTRRTFVATTLAALGTAALLPVSAAARVRTSRNPRAPLTVREIIDTIVTKIPGAPFKETVDSLKVGSPDQPVTGIVTTMFATVEVIRKAIDLKANFIIAHEPTFYNHLDDTAWLEHDRVYQFKAGLLEKNSIALWRFHDYLHALRPDGVMMGLLKALDWDRYYDAKNPRMITLPPTSLDKIISHLKEKLGIPHVRVMGDRSQVCQRIALLPGAAGGRRQIELLQKEKPDLLICGELQEWETSEYIRDDRAMGTKASLVVLGHAVSEEPGMQWLVDWLKPLVPDLSITHVPSGDPFTWV